MMKDGTKLRPIILPNEQMNWSMFAVVSERTELIPREMNEPRLWVMREQSRSSLELNLESVEFSNFQTAASSSYLCIVL